MLGYVWNWLDMAFTMTTLIVPAVVAFIAIKLARRDGGQEDNR